ncbi:Zinc finger protein 182 [Frankliniella fusca]|uniref:Zinc finger protein 182 n=1 Tax=Frankliniella fusca TaxID=407009 RepID=A0AAE1H645_9NEOP|nr:Zinc finger protein 182 [Frankliniella fusca]
MLTSLIEDRYHALPTPLGAEAEVDLSLWEKELTVEEAATLPPDLLAVEPFEALSSAGWNVDTLSPTPAPPVTSPAPLAELAAAALPRHALQTYCFVCKTSVADMRTHVNQLHRGPSGQRFRCSECGMKFGKHRLLADHCTRAHSLQPQHGAPAGGESATSTAGGVVAAKRRGRPPGKCLPRLTLQQRLKAHRQQAQRVKAQLLKVQLLQGNHRGVGSQLLEGARYVLDEETQRLVRLEENQCDVCLRVLTTKSSLKMHYRSHTGERPFKCGECEMAFTKKGDLGRHLLIHANAKPFPCSICGYDEDGGVFLEPLRCSVCRALFSTPSNLKRHQLTHTRERPYKCGECGMGFKRTDYLSRHALSHSKQKPLACPECGLGFRQSSHLKRHVRKRHGLLPAPLQQLVVAPQPAADNPMQCSTCGVVLSSTSNLKRHFKTHTGERPYRCSVCGVSYTQSNNLKRSQVFGGGFQADVDGGHLEPEPGYPHDGYPRENRVGYPGSGGAGGDDGGGWRSARLAAAPLPALWEGLPLAAEPDGPHALRVRHGAVLRLPPLPAPRAPQPPPQEAHARSSAPGHFACPDCYKAYKYRKSLIRHLRYECNMEPQQLCKLCPYKAKLRSNLIRHVREKHLQPPA